MITTQVLFLIFRDLHLKPYDIPKLRGYFASNSKHIRELHNHLEQNKFDYRFPRIHYRIIQGNPALVAIKEGVEIIKNLFFETEKIILDQDRCFETKEKIIQVKQYEFGQTAQPQKYQFVSPWLALNEENYRQYRNMDHLERQLLLKKILKGNLMTIAKGFDYQIPDVDGISIEGIFYPKAVNFKNVKMQAFTGSFLVNFCIPEWFGLGKQSARGFGVINRKEEHGDKRDCRTRQI